MLRYILKNLSGISVKTDASLQRYHDHMLPSLSPPFCCPNNGATEHLTRRSHSYPRAEKLRGLQTKITDFDKQHPGEIFIQHKEYHQKSSIGRNTKSLATTKKERENKGDQEDRQQSSNDNYNRKYSCVQYELEAARPRKTDSNHFWDSLKERELHGSDPTEHLQPRHIKPFGSTDNAYYPYPEQRRPPATIEIMESQQDQDSRSVSSRKIKKFPEFQSRNYSTHSTFVKLNTLFNDSTSSFRESLAQEFTKGVAESSNKSKNSQDNSSQKVDGSIRPQTAKSKYPSENKKNNISQKNIKRASSLPHVHQSQEISTKSKTDGESQLRAIMSKYMKIDEKLQQQATILEKILKKTESEKKLISKISKSKISNVHSTMNMPVIQCQEELLKKAGTSENKGKEIPKIMKTVSKSFREQVPLATDVPFLFLQNESKTDLLSMKYNKSLEEVIEQHAKLPYSAIKSSQDSLSQNSHQAGSWPSLSFLKNKYRIRLASEEYMSKMKSTSLKEDNKPANNTKALDNESKESNLKPRVFDLDQNLESLRKLEKAKPQISTLNTHSSKPVSEDEPKSFVYEYPIFPYKTLSTLKQPASCDTNESKKKNLNASLVETDLKSGESKPHDYDDTTNPKLSENYNTTNNDVRLSPQPVIPISLDGNTIETDKNKICIADESDLGPLDNFGTFSSSVNAVNDEIRQSSEAQKPFCSLEADQKRKQPSTTSHETTERLSGVTNNSQASEDMESTEPPKLVAELLSMDDKGYLPPLAVVEVCDICDCSDTINVGQSLRESPAASGDSGQKTMCKEPVTTMCDLKKSGTNMEQNNQMRQQLISPRCYSTYQVSCELEKDCKKNDFQDTLTSLRNFGTKCLDNSIVSVAAKNVLPANHLERAEMVKTMGLNSKPTDNPKVKVDNKINPLQICHNIFDIPEYWKMQVKTQLESMMTDDKQTEMLDERPAKKDDWNPIVSKKIEGRDENGNREHYSAETPLFKKPGQEERCGGIQNRKRLDSKNKRIRTNQEVSNYSYTPEQLTSVANRLQLIDCSYKNIRNSDLTSISSILQSSQKRPCCETGVTKVGEAPMKRVRFSDVVHIQSALKTGENIAVATSLNTINERNVENGLLQQNKKEPLIKNEKRIGSSPSSREKKELIEIWSSASLRAENKEATGPIQISDTDRDKNGLTLSQAQVVAKSEIMENDISEAFGTRANKKEHKRRSAIKNTKGDTSRTRTTFRASPSRKVVGTTKVRTPVRFPDSRLDLPKSYASMTISRQKKLSTKLAQPATANGAINKKPPFLSSMAPARQFSTSQQPSSHQEPDLLEEPLHKSIDHVSLLPHQEGVEFMNYTGKGQRGTNRPSKASKKESEVPLQLERLEQFRPGSPYFDLIRTIIPEMNFEDINKDNSDQKKFTLEVRNKDLGKIPAKNSTQREIRHLHKILRDPEQKSTGFKKFSTYTGKTESEDPERNIDKNEEVINNNKFSTSNAFVREYHILSKLQDRKLTDKNDSIKYDLKQNSFLNDECKTIENLNSIRWQINNFYKWHKLNKMSNIQITLKRFYSCINFQTPSKSSSTLSPEFIKGRSYFLQSYPPVKWDPDQLNLKHKNCTLASNERIKRELKKANNQIAIHCHIPADTREHDKAKYDGIQPKYALLPESGTHSLSVSPSVNSLNPREEKDDKCDNYLCASVEKEQNSVNPREEKDGKCDNYLCASVEKEQLFPRYHSRMRRLRKKKTHDYVENPSKDTESETFFKQKPQVSEVFVESVGYKADDKSERYTEETGAEQHEETTIWQRIINYFKARPNCPSPDEWKKKAAREKAEKYARQAGLIVCEKENVLKNPLEKPVPDEDLPKVITYSSKTKRYSSYLHKSCKESLKREFHANVVVLRKNRNNDNVDKIEYDKSYHKNIQGTSIVTIGSDHSKCHKQKKSGCNFNVQNRYFSTSMRHRMPTKKEDEDNDSVTLSNDSKDSADSEDTVDQKVKVIPEKEIPLKYPSEKRHLDKNVSIIPRRSYSKERHHRALEEINKTLEDKEKQILAERIVRTILEASLNNQEQEDGHGYHDLDAGVRLPGKLNLSEIIFSDPKDEYGTYCQAKCMAAFLEIFHKTEVLSDCNYEDLETIKTNKLVNELNKLIREDKADHKK